MEHKRIFIINFVYYAITLTIAYFLFRFAVDYLAPFIFGLLIAMILKPLVRRAQKLLKTKNKIISIIIVLIFYLTIVMLISLLAIRLVSALALLFKDLPDIYTDSIQPALNTVFTNLQQFFADLNISSNETMDSIIESILESLKTSVSSLSNKALSFTTSYITAIPNLLLSAIIGIIASIFFVLDYQTIVNFFIKYLPERPKKLLFDAKEYLFKVIFKYIKSYAILMTLTFIELSIGLSILKVNNPIAVAFLIALIDILPVLGTGAVVIPWFIIELILGNVSLGIGLIILYAIITVIRNIMEPRIVGHQIGLHPLVTLICIYVGTKLFGFIGLFGLPILVALLKAMHDQGKINVFNTLDERYNTTKNEDQE